MTDKKYDLDSMEGRIAYAIDSVGQSEMARRTGISLTQLHRIAKGAKTTLENAVKISLESQFNMAWLAFGEGPQQTMASAGIMKTDFIEFESYRAETPFLVSFHRKFLEEQGLGNSNLVGWCIDVETKISQFKIGDDVLLSLDNKTGAGFFVVKLKGDEMVALIEPLMDGRYSVIADQNKQAQILTQAQFEQLELIGKIVWPKRSF